MRAVSLHRDVIVVTSAILQVNCAIVRGDFDASDESGLDPSSNASPAGEAFVIDSPVLPDELDALPALLEQARFPSPSGLLATHGDWDHLLGRLAFPELALGCAETTAQRLASSAGDAQRELRAFDEQLMIDRSRPLALGSVQALPVPGRCAIGDRELELHRVGGHGPDGMAISIPWARILIAGDYLSAVELPTLGGGGDIDTYIATLEQLAALSATAEHVIPGHGAVLDRERALVLQSEDLEYMNALRDNRGRIQLPLGRRTARDRRTHAQNVSLLSADSSK